VKRLDFIHKLILDFVVAFKTFHESHIVISKVTLATHKGLITYGKILDFERNVFA